VPAGDFECGFGIDGKYEYGVVVKSASQSTYGRRGKKAKYSKLIDGMWAYATIMAKM